MDSIHGIKIFMNTRKQCWSTEVAQDEAYQLVSTLERPPIIIAFLSETADLPQICHSVELTALPIV